MSGNGYCGQSMSNNAIAAYQDGEMPKSKWTKAALLEGIYSTCEEIISDGESKSFSFEVLSKAPVAVLRSLCLCNSSWHHTSKFYLITDFYNIDRDALTKLTDGDIADAIAIYKREKSEAKSAKAEVEVWKCQFLVWSGSRNHPKATEVIEIGEIKGNWFYRSDGTKKSLMANGFKKLKLVEKH
ncbi:MAG: hypothetical protein RRX88_06910 [Raoultibacter sp.]